MDGFKRQLGHWSRRSQTKPFGYGFVAVRNPRLRFTKSAANQYHTLIKERGLEIMTSLLELYETFKDECLVSIAIEATNLLELTLL